MPDSALHVPLFRGLIRQDVDSHAYGYRYEAKAQYPMFSYKDSAEKQGQPYDIHVYTKRYKDLYRRNLVFTA